MDTTALKPIIEAMIFVSDEPITEGSIVAALADAGVEKGDVRSCLDQIEREWNGDAARGIGLSQVAGGYQFRTKADHAEWLRRLNVPKPMRLSGPALETLAIVAYRQPIVRSELEKIRGVDSGGVLKTLLERRLLRIVGRRDEPGQPLLYGTTKEFLEIFNLNALTELPTLKDIEELMRERRTLTESNAAAAALAKDAGDETEEDLTEVCDFADEEEETEIIPKEIITDDDEEDPDEKDMEALSDLEQSLKDLRRLERNIFPKPVGEEAVDGAGTGEGMADGEAKQAPQGAVIAEASAETPAKAADSDAGGADAPGPDDCPFK